jgi:uncharacterized protein YndB with AHSA1/START domain
MDNANRALIEVCVSRDILAPAQVLYDTWLDNARPGGPWHGAKKVMINAKVDGLFYHAVDFAGKTWNHYGRFLRLERARLIEHSWMSEATQGIDSIVRMSLAQLGGGTLVTLTHQRLPDDHMGRSHEQGWEALLEGLEQAVLGPVKAR